MRGRTEVLELLPLISSIVIHNEEVGRIFGASGTSFCSAVTESCSIMAAFASPVNVRCCCRPCEASRRLLWSGRQHTSGGSLRQNQAGCVIQKRVLNDLDIVDSTQRPIGRNWL